MAVDVEHEKAVPSISHQQLQTNRQDKNIQPLSKDTNNTSSCSSMSSTSPSSSDCSLVVVKRMRYLEELVKRKFGLENVSDIQWLTDEDAPVVVDSNNNIP
eukprot:GHVS01076059.1.p1 GENE.GHVS01076059.1~~GHVS01076059.1.p1  ORF type:complete len:101 (+),score=27.49 GHVS01076059.1:387-689(+)